MFEFGVRHVNRLQFLDKVAVKGAEPVKRSDDEDEDIIDLGKDEDLDFEIKNDENPEPKVIQFNFIWARNAC